jgi:DNA adenine methylase
MTMITLAHLQSDRTNPSPFVKWAGGKSSLVQELLHYVPSHFANYFEPFLGGGAFFFAICSRNRGFNANLSDVNAELISAYEVIRDQPDELIQLLSKFQEEYFRTGSRSSYYYQKRQWKTTDPIESASRLIFLNKTCYNGLYRVNSHGEFNVPFGRYRNPKIVDRENIRAVSNALKDTNAQLRCSNYKTVISRCGKGDLVYLDPPYQPKSKTSSFTDYTPGGFSEKDQEELAEEFKKLVDRGCNVLLSNSETPLTSHLYSGYQTKSLVVNRPINSVGSGRTGYKELLVLGKTKPMPR